MRDEFNILYAFAVVSAVIISFIIGWCQGDMHSRRTKTETKEDVSTIKISVSDFRCLNDHIEILEKENELAYDKGWNDCYKQFKFNSSTNISRKLRTFHDETSR